jgi:hypothetical protein
VTEQIDTKRVLAPDSVGKVGRETAFERFLDALPTGHMVVAVLGTIATFTLCVVVLFSESVPLKEYKSGAWAIISGFAGAFLTYLFGDNRKPL